jgi:predicted solute-binding protein
MLAGNDAAVLIGDKGMSTSADGLYMLDLGEEWTKLTGLPFVWAMWIGNESLSGELVSELNRSARWGETQTEMIAQEAAKATNIPYDSCFHYLSKVMDYRLTEEHLKGLRAYRDLLLKHGILETSMFPTPVSASAVAIAT